jgi:hypothetical protein
LFAGDPKLEAAAVSDPAHIKKAAIGDHVRKIRVALSGIRLYIAVHEMIHACGLSNSEHTASPEQAMATDSSACTPDESDFPEPCTVRKYYFAPDHLTDLSNVVAYPCRGGGSAGRSHPSRVA